MDKREICECVPLWMNMGDLLESLPNAIQEPFHITITKNSFSNMALVHAIDR